MDFAGLRPYQVQHLRQLVPALMQNKSALDASDTGTGKTYCALAIARALGVVPIVIGPKSARAGWEDAAKIIGVEIEYINYEKARAVAKRNNGLVDTEWLLEKPWGSGSYLKWKENYCLMIFDEVHRCGGTTTKNSKMLIAAKRQAQYVLALSATAAENPLQMKALGYTLGLHTLNGNRTGFRDWILRNGCKPAWAGGFEFTSDPVKQKETFKNLHGKIFPARGARMRKADIPGFPETQIEVKLLTDPEGKAADLAQELHELYEFRQRQADQESGMVEIIRRKQALELLMVPEWIALTEDYKLTSKVVHFVNYRETREQLVYAAEKAGISVAFIDGTNAEERPGIINRFQANRLDLLVANAMVGGESINAQDPTGQVERTTLIAPVDSGRQAKQIVGRVHRDGGARSLQLFTFFAGTVQETVANRMRQKGCNLDLLNDGDFIC